MESLWQRGWMGLLVSSQKDGVVVLEKWFHHFSNTPLPPFIEKIWLLFIIEPSNMLLDPQNASRKEIDL
jgi:hypothetical protein